MVLEAETTITQSKDAHTQYLIIPAVMVQDSQYPFKKGDKIRIAIDPSGKRIIITLNEQIALPPKSNQVKADKSMVEE